MRAIAAPILLGLLAQGCIVYEERHRHDRDDLDCDGCVLDDPTEPGDPGEVTDPQDPQDPPEDPGPVLTSELFLTVDAGLPGDTLLSTLEATDDGFDLSEVVAVEFGRDIAVLDLIARDDEVVLLLEIADDAEPGSVDCYIDTASGGSWLLDVPFTVLDPADAPTECPEGGGEDTGAHGGGTDEDPCP